MNIDAARLSRPFGFPLPAEAWRRDGVRDLSARWPAGGRGIRDYRLLSESLRGIHAAQQAPAAGDLLCGALLSDALGDVWARYVRDQQPGVLERVLGRASQRLGSAALSRALEGFLGRFTARTAEAPPVTGPARGLLAGELILRLLAQENPALRPVLQASGDAEGLDSEQAALARLLLDLLEDEPALALTGLSLPASLRAPAQACPEGLEAQLAWVREHWAALLPESLLGRFGLAVDLSREERFQRGGPPGPPPVLSFEPPADEAPAPAAYSHDADWMPNVVLMAKSAYVWLYQLSRTWGRPITTLDRIPDEELDKLARWGVSGLWLIGLWRRSEASRDIKRIMGNQEAAASAYALYDYAIVPELGGEAAFQDLKARAWARGIRLAGDMVPNHVGLDARWVIEHPRALRAGRGAAVPLLPLRRPRSVRRPPRRALPGGRLLDPQRRRRGLQAPRPPDRPDPVHLPRQRRHLDALERHGPARLPAGGRARGGHPDHPGGGPPLPHHPLRRGHDPGQEALPAAVVPEARGRGQRALPRGARHVEGGLRRRLPRGILA
ncbi:MAG: alpha-amylase family glycosyl hydrolase [Pseudomonadota bacterium]